MASGDRSNFTLSLGCEEGKEDTRTSFSQRLDAIFGGLENKAHEKNPMTDTLAKPEQPSSSSSSSSVPKSTNPKIRACFSCGSQSHLSRACPHPRKGSGSANNPTSQYVPSYLKDSSKYTHYTIEKDYDALEEKKSALNFIQQLQKKKDEEENEDEKDEEAKSSININRDGIFVPRFAPKNQRTKKKKTGFSTNSKKPNTTNSTISENTFQIVKEDSKSVIKKTELVSLSHLEDEEIPEDLKTIEVSASTFSSNSMIINTPMDKEKDISMTTSDITFKKKKKGRKQFRKNIADQTGSKDL